MLRVFILLVSLTGAIGCNWGSGSSSNKGDSTPASTEGPPTLMYNCTSKNLTNTSSLVEVLEYNGSCTVMVDWKGQGANSGEFNENLRINTCNFIGSDVCSNCSINGSYAINQTGVLFSCYNEYDYTTTAETTTIASTTADESTTYQDTENGSIINSTKPQKQEKMDIVMPIAIACSVLIIIIIALVLIKHRCSRKNQKQETNGKRTFSKGEGGQGGDVYAVVNKEKAVVENILYGSTPESAPDSSQTKNNNTYTVALNDSDKESKNNILYSQRASLEIDDKNPAVYSVVKKRS